METEAKSYHKKVDLVVDFEENEDLTGSARINFSLKDGEDYEEALDEEIAGWLDEQIDYEALCKEYKAKGIATIVFLSIIREAPMQSVMMVWIIRRKAL